MGHLLTNAPFRRLLTGRLVTNIADSLYYIAAMWLVYSLGGSAFYTGLAGFLARIPMSMQFLIGPIVDRYPLRGLLVLSPLVQAAILSIIPLAAWAGVLSVWVVLVVMPLVAAAAQFGPPAQNAALPRIVKRDSLASANTAFTVAYNGTDIVFITLGGILVGLVGAVAIFVLDTVLLAIAALVLVFVAVPPANGDERADGGSTTPSIAEYLVELREGFDYYRGSILFPMLAASIVINFVVGTMMAVLPAYADGMGGSTTYGLMLAAMTGGMLIGALAAPTLERFPLSHLVIGTSAGSAIAWTVAVTVPSLGLTLGLFTVTWVSAGTINVLSATLKQSYVPETMLGRASSIGFSVAVAAMPIGSLLGGVLASLVGVTPVMYIVTIGFGFMSLYWVLIPQLRRLPAVPDIDPVACGLREDPPRTD